jgi:PRTRC genetic system protein E
MFVELIPLLRERTVMITVACATPNSIRVNVIPSRKKEDENAALATPLTFSGTAEELDRELGKSLVSYVEENLGFQSTLAEAKAEMDAATKAARELARAKTGPSTKKQEETAAKETVSTTPPTEQSMTLFTTSEK